MWFGVAEASASLSIITKDPFGVICICKYPLCHCYCVVVIRLGVYSSWPITVEGVKLNYRDQVALLSSSLSSVPSAITYKELQVCVSVGGKISIVAPSFGGCGEEWAWLFVITFICLHQLKFCPPLLLSRVSPESIPRKGKQFLCPLCYSDPQQNAFFFLLATSFYRVSWKWAHQFFCHPAERQTNKTTNPTENKPFWES